MTEEDLQLIKDVIHQIGNGGSYIISQYAEWYFVNAIVWLGFGLVLLGLSALIFKKTENELYKFLSVVLSIASLICIGANIANIIHPEPHAIYALMKGIKCKNF